MLISKREVPDLAIQPHALGSWLPEAQTVLEHCDYASAELFIWESQIGCTFEHPAVPQYLLEFKVHMSRLGDTI